MSIKYIFITGGVLSSLGKGLASASIGCLLEHRNFKISMLKLDPYLNIDPGTMSPFQHGEVYVTKDGAETDLDLGHYYRFTNSIINKNTNATAGQIYFSVLSKERKGGYLGKTIQVIPHITQEIKNKILLYKNTKIVIVEIGGTVGDIESLPFLEAIRQFKRERPKDCINVHLTYIPFIKSAKELKTKPTQHSVQILRGIGIVPDIILCRSENLISQEIKEKIALFCNVEKENVIDAVDVKNNIYEIPLLFKKQKIDQRILKILNLPIKPSNLKKWENFVKKTKKLKNKNSIKIAIVGKYVKHEDAYKSIYESLFHSSVANNIKVEIKKIDSTKITAKNVKEKLLDCSGILVPGGYDKRGFEGKILAIKFARENKIPFFGICLGMQAMIIEFARNVLKLKDANSTEMDKKTKYPVVDIMENQKKIKKLGGTMRKGRYLCHLQTKTLAYSAYKKQSILERHRHRYEFNNFFKKIFLNTKKIVFSGTFKKNDLVEIAEIKNHPFCLAVQFHPEFLSKPLSPHPLFNLFIKKAKEYEKK